MRSWLAGLGPGLLYAGAAVGVSHVVQSTRAGALYGFGLVGFVLLVNLLKYPFFSYASRYARHSGHDLIEGYGRMHRWVLPAFLLLTVATMFPILVAITSVFTGKIAFAPCHHHSAMGPMARIVSASMPVFIVRNDTFGNYAYCTLNEGLGKVLRYGVLIS